jgi:erythromycin esterase-like protein
MKNLTFIGLLLTTLTLTSRADLSWAQLPNGIREITAAEKPNELSHQLLHQWLGKKLDNYPGYAIGESIHGSVVYEQIHFDLIKYLVKKQGVRIIFWETAINRSLPLTEYIESCTMGPTPALTEKVLNGFYYPTNTLKNLIQWVCKFNQAHPRNPIALRGMDIWDRTWELQNTLEKIASQYEIGIRPALAQARAYCWGSNVSGWDEYYELMGIAYKNGAIPSEFLVPCREALSIIKAALEAPPIKLPRRVLSHGLWAFENLQARFNHLHHSANPNTWHAGWNVRDRSQAQNIGIHWKELRRKKFVWIAHISHVSKAGSLAAWWDRGYGLLNSAGEFIKKDLGLDIFTIGLTSYKAEGEQGDYLAPTDPQSLDLQLHQYQKQILGVDVQRGLVSTKEKWFVQNENSTAYPNGVWLKPSDHYDAMIYVDHTPKAEAVTTLVDSFFP